METNRRRTMNEHLIAVRCIHQLARYFAENFVTEDEHDCIDKYSYAVEAFEILADYETREEYKDFECLMGQKTYEDFAKYLEESSLIDTIVNLFESR